MKPIKATSTCSAGKEIPNGILWGSYIINLACLSVNPIYVICLVSYLCQQCLVSSVVSTPRGTTWSVCGFCWGQASGIISNGVDKVGYTPTRTCMSRSVRKLVIVEPPATLYYIHMCLFFDVRVTHKLYSNRDTPSAKELSLLEGCPLVRGSIASIHSTCCQAQHQHLHFDWLYIFNKGYKHNGTYWFEGRWGLSPCWTRNSPAHIGCVCMSHGPGVMYARGWLWSGDGGRHSTVVTRAQALAHTGQIWLWLGWVDTTTGHTSRVATRRGDALQFWGIRIQQMPGLIQFLLFGA